MNINKNALMLILGIIGLYIWITVLFFFQPITSGYDYFVRLCVLLGFTSIFITTTTTAFMKQLYQLFGKPFIKIHHIFSILGLILVTIHPVAFAIQQMDPLVFLPRFDSWLIFWELAGRPALYLIYIAVLVVLIRKKLSPKIWKSLHTLNYIALIFAYLHAILIGTDLVNMGLAITFTAMFVITLQISVYRRYQKYKLKKK